MQSAETTSPEGSWFARFMASGYGRMARLAFGLAVVAAGLFAVPWPTGLLVAVLGLVPIAAGAFNLCPVAPAWGGHFIGARYCGRPDAHDTDNR